MNQVPTFYGYPDESILSFFEDLEGYFGIKRMTSNDKRNALMHSRLKGTARALYETTIARTGAI